MRSCLTVVLLFAAFQPAQCQDSADAVFYRAGRMGRHYLVSLDQSGALVYRLGKYIDKAGSGPSIRSTDTLQAGSDGIFAGAGMKIILEGDARYLIAGPGRKDRHLMKLYEDQAIARTILNHGYFLDQYFDMSRALNERYPLNHHSFREGFYRWKALDHTSADHEHFRVFADDLIGAIRDSISRAQDSFVALTNPLVQNMESISYDDLKQSLLKLPADYKYVSWYFGTVVGEAAKRRPEYFFRIAEDLSEHRSLIFDAVIDEDATVRGLRAVTGHEEVQRAFIKERRFRKTMMIHTLGIYAAFGGLLIWLAVSQK